MAFQAVRIQQSVVEFILNHREQIFSSEAAQIKPKEGKTSVQHVLDLRHVGILLTVTRFVLFQGRVWCAQRNMQPFQLAVSAGPWNWWAWRRLRLAPWAQTIPCIKNGSGRTACQTPAPLCSTTQSSTYRTASTAAKSRQVQCFQCTLEVKIKDIFVPLLGGNCLGNPRSGGLSSTWAALWTRRENWVGTAASS